MLKLLTKFKTQSLNEVKPYESNGSFVSFCGQPQLDDRGVPNNSQTQVEFVDSQGEGLTNNHGCPSRVVFPTTSSTTCSNISRSQQNECTRTVQTTVETVPMQLALENKENGDRVDAASLRKQAGLSSAEKRKWSETKRHRGGNGASSKLQSAGDSSSSDEEVKELFSKQQRSEKSFARSLNNENRECKSSRGKVRPCENGHARKRHRLTFEDRIYRPSLDFEKMQQKVFWRKSSYSSSRPRIVKVRSFSGHPHNLFQDASVVSFQPIKTMKAFKLTPVEEPQALAY